MVSSCTTEVSNSEAFFAPDFAAGLAETESYNLENQNVNIVRGLYDALREEDHLFARKFLAEDIDWWFHGPRRMPLRDVKHFQMMPLLIGSSIGHFSPFEPVDYTARSDKVFVEGIEKSVSKRKGTITWVHIWTIKDGKVTGLREYVNTAVSCHVYAAVMKPSLVNVSKAVYADNLVWESKLWRDRDVSTPGLIITI